MNRIVFTNLEGQIEIIRPDGTGRAKISNDNRFYQFPAWSPDGDMVAAIGNEGPNGVIVVFEPFEPGEIDLREVYASEQEPPFYLYWAPDGHKISFLSTHPRGGIGLHCLPVAGGPSLFLGMGQPFFWAWRPQGDELLMHINGGSQRAKLSFIDPLNGYETPSVAEPGFFQTPGISPTDEYYAFATGLDDGKVNLTIEHGKTRSRMNYQHTGSVILSWSPTEDLLAYISPSSQVRHFYGPLFLVDPEKKEQVRLVDEMVLAFMWSPNGRYIAYFTMVQAEQNGLEIYEGYASGRSLPDEANYSLWLNLNVVDVYTGRKRLLTPFKPTSLFVNQFMPFFDQYALSHRIWSPKSDALVIPALINESEMIVVVPLNGFPPVLIAEGLTASWSTT